MPPTHAFNPELFRFDPAADYPWLVFPRTTVAITAWNRLERTKALLDTLLRHTHLPHELLVVDNGSTDGTGEFLAALAEGAGNVRVISNRRNLGLGRAHQQIRDAVEDGLLVVFDNDVRVLSNYWLVHLQKAYHALRLATGDTRAALGIRLINHEEYGFRFALRREVLRIPGEENAPPRTSFAAACKDEPDEVRRLDEEVVVGWSEHLNGGAFAVPAELYRRLPLHERYPDFIGGVDGFFSTHMLELGVRLGYLENGPIARHDDWPYTEEKIAAYEAMVGRRAALDGHYVRWKLRRLLRRLRGRSEDR